MVNAIDRPAAAATQTGTLLMLDPRELVPDERNERGEVTPESDPDLEGLVGSIRQNGVLEPLRVYVSQKKHVISSGHRRQAAAIIAGLEEVPCYLVEKPAFVKGEIQRIVSNIQRRDINPVALAVTIKSLRESYPDMSQATLASYLGMSQPRLANLMRLLKLPDQVLDYVADGRLTAGHGLALLRIEEPLLDYTGKATPKDEAQRDMAQRWVAQGTSVHDAEYRIDQELSSQKWIRQRRKETEEWDRNRAEREAKRENLTVEEMEAKRKEERRQTIIEGRARTKRVRAAQAALMEAVEVFRDQDEGLRVVYARGVNMEHIRFMALSLNRGYMMADTRKAWGLPSSEDMEAQIMDMSEEGEMLTWCARLAMAHMLEVEYDGKGFRVAAGAFSRTPMSELADATWGISEAINRALQADDPALLANQAAG